MIDNNELRTFIENYKKNPKDNDLLYYFDKIKGLFKLYSYRDPSNILTPKDIEIVALEGFWKAIRKYDSTRWENSISWCYHISRQQILRELKKTYKKNYIVINSTMNKDLDIEQISDKRFNEEGFTIEFPDSYLRDIRKICFELENVSIKASKTFQLKLAFPFLSRNSISKILKFKRRNGLAKVVKIIRAVSKNNLDIELYDIT